MLEFVVLLNKVVGHSGFEMITKTLGFDHVVILPRLVCVPTHLLTQQLEPHIFC